MSAIVKQYDYKPKWTIVFLAGGFFALCAVSFIYLALTDDRGAVINGIVRLSPTGAKVFYWVLAALSSGFVVAAALIAYVRLTVTQRIAITTDGILFPAGGWTSQECYVAFRDIVALKRLEAYGEVFLYVYAGGLRYTVIKGMLPDKGGFEDIVSTLEAQTKLEFE